MKSKLVLGLKVIVVLLALFAIKAYIKESRRSRVVEETVKVIEEVAPAPLKPAVEPRIVKVKKLKLDPTRTILIQGPIGGEMIQAAQILAQMNAESTTEPIYVVLNSPGGSVLDGALFISAMQASKAPVYTVCVRICASMAAMIHQYGTKRMAVDRAIIMFHPASGGAEGEVDKMASRIGMIQKYILKIERDVALRQGLSLAQYKEKCAIEYWIDGADGLSANVVDELVNVEIDSAQQARGYSEGEESITRDVKW